MSNGWSSNWYQDPFDDPFSDMSSNQNSCPHRHVIVEVTGCRRFTGEVEDNFKEHLRCLDCLEYLCEAKIRGAWEGDSLKYLDLPTGEDHEDK